MVFEPPKLLVYQKDLGNLTEEAFGYKYRGRYVFAGGPGENIENSLEVAGRTITNPNVKEADNGFALSLDSWVYFFELSKPDDFWEQIWVGRACNCVIIIPQSYRDVSGGHALLKRYYDKDGVYIIDKSKFNTYLNNKELKEGIEERLDDGDIVRLARRIKLMFLTPESLHRRVQHLL